MLISENIYIFCTPNKIFMTYDQIIETKDYLLNKYELSSLNIQTGIILGSGLGELKNEVNIIHEIPYSTIPNFPISTVEGHSGSLIIGEKEGINVLLLAGRFHFYEGYNMQEVTFPVRVMKALGIKNLIVSNAAGGMNPDFKVGDIMFIKDHINLFPEHPLRGRNDERLGVRFPDMSEPYALDFIELAENIAAEAQIPVFKGVYVGLQGPTFETRAEYKYLRVIGGDAVGMSTVPEVIVAIHSGMKVFAASIITDLGIRDELNTITHEEVLEAAQKATPLLTKIVLNLALKIQA